VREWTADEIGLLGTKPDREVAREMNRTVIAVRIKRLKLGIAGAERPLQRPWSHAEDLLLGTFTDSELAKRLGRTIGSVASRRHGRGISPRR
jgi:hypothetical protein